jgi:hypothetical protein
LILQAVESFKIIKFKINFKKLIMISLFDTSSIVESFKIIKFKRNLKGVIMISLFDTSSS